MNSLFEVTAADITRLHEDPFADVLNRLLRAEGSQLGLRPDQISTTLRTNEPDAGVDAAVLESNETSEWIPSGASIWQYKSGDVEPAEILDEEMIKPGVKEAIASGATYCFCVGVELTTTKLRNRRRAIEEGFRRAGYTAKYRLYDATHIAEMVSKHRALCFLPEFGRPLSADFMLWESWQAQPRYSQPYFADQARTDIASQIRDWLQRRESVHHRIEGMAGIGKSRLALEVFRPQNPSDGLHQRVLYALSDRQVPAGIFQWIGATPKSELILVVDECDVVQMERLKQLAESCQGRLLLLTIGQAHETRAAVPSADTYVLDKLSPDAMGELLRNSFGSFPREVIEFIVHHSSGFVKLADALARAILRHPELPSARQLLETAEVKQVLDLLLPEAHDRRVLQAVALLSRIGWESDVAEEGKVVTAFLGLEWRDAQLGLGRYVQEGWVSKQGRYRYVSPHILAVWLAAEVWQNLGMETIDLLPALPTMGSRYALLRRLHDLGDDARAVEITGALLGPEGLFPTIESISDETRAQVFALLAQSNPLAGLRALQRLLEHLPRDELLMFRAGRRQIVPLLERLAWLPESFVSVSRILLQMAEAENETWANNASGVWAGLFGTYLGGTAVAALQRHTLLQEALASDSEEKQLLVVKATERALASEETRAFNGIERGWRVVPPEWRPASLEEDRRVRSSALSLLGRALNHQSLKVREAAQEALHGQAASLVRMGLTGAVLDLLESVLTEHLEDREKVRRTLDGLLEFESSYLTSAESQRVTILRDVLVGSSFCDRLRRWTGTTTLADFKREKEPGARTSVQEAELLAEEAMENPELLRSELDWVATEAQIPYHFAHRLGELDANLYWWRDIQSLVETGSGYAFASAYIQGQSDVGRRKWRDNILADWTLRGGALAYGVLDAVWRGGEPVDQDSERLITLLNRGELRGSQFGAFIFGGLVQHFSIVNFQRLMQAIVGDENPGVTGVTLGLLYTRLQLRPHEENTLAEVVWLALERPDCFAGDTMSQFYAEHLAERYIVRDPLRIARLVIGHVQRSGGVLLRESKSIRLLERATQLQPASVWNEVADWLDSKPVHYIELYLALQGWYAQTAGADVVISWAAQHRIEGPQLVASLTTPRGNPLDAVTRGLLLTYPDNRAVASALFANLQSGTFLGDISDWLLSQINAATEWLADPEPAVRRWAQAVIESLEKQRSDALLREEEAAA